MGVVALPAARPMPSTSENSWRATAPMADAVRMGRRTATTRAVGAMNVGPLTTERAASGSSDVVRPLSRALLATERLPVPSLDAGDAVGPAPGPNRDLHLGAARDVPRGDLRLVHVLRLF